MQYFQESNPNFPDFCRVPGFPVFPRVVGTLIIHVGFINSVITIVQGNVLIIIIDNIKNKDKYLKFKLVHA